jgi:hypothetical protein
MIPNRIAAEDVSAASKLVRPAQSPLRIGSMRAAAFLI